MERVFSDFEIDELGIKFKGKENYQLIKCIGSLEEEMDARVITKKCRGVVRKKKVRGTGTGKYKITAHIPWSIYTEFYGMTLDALIEGVRAYGENSVHGEFSSVAHVKDEDGVEKLKAYPNCVIETGVVRKIENGAEEVAELELEVSVMPDEHGNGLYEALVDELTDEEVKTKWLTAFTPELVQVAEA